MNGRPVLTTTRGAAAWCLDLSRQERSMSEPLPELAQVTLRHAAHHCAGVAAEMILDRNAAMARVWADAYRLLTDRAARADRARLGRAQAVAA
jgi:hypothetical protein